VEPVWGNPRKKEPCNNKKKERQTATLDTACCVEDHRTTASEGITATTAVFWRKPTFKHTWNLGSKKHNTV
jgi:hypothetical protein